eukprot:TRINITY_DN5497_c0_g2_i1.p1 TRINITY_DN5497_c0_g2~~TRINITY_DN5497_c0_g2_i1.p1  ORF type:complete len:199 (-),score=16.87 TRINITY_DN5497_c0_g2_i1:65-661(-)
MACVAEIIQNPFPPENTRKRRKLASSWDVLPSKALGSQAQDLRGETPKRRRKHTSSWDVLPSGVKIQSPHEISAQNTMNCATVSTTNENRNGSPPWRPDGKDGHYRFELGDNLTRRYQILSKMGEGTFGQVLECWDRNRNDRVAIKVVRGNQKYREEAMIEIDMIRKVSEYEKSKSWYDSMSHIVFWSSICLFRAKFK